MKMVTMEVPEKFKVNVLEFINQLLINEEHNRSLTLKERQKEGIEKAKKAGVYKGRKPNKDLHEQIIKLRNEGVSIRKIAQQLECGISTVQRITDAKLGRPEAIETTEKILKLKEKGLTQTQVAMAMNVSVRTIKRHWNKEVEPLQRSLKAKAACERRKVLGLSNGRSVGAKVKSKLDAHAVFIMDELKKGTKKTKIVELLKNKGLSVTRAGLYCWIRKYE